MTSNNLKIYSKGRSKRRSSRAYARNHSLAWVWLLVGMLLGLLGALLFYTQILTTQKGIAGAGGAGSAGSKAAIANAKKAPVKQYEFYSILPGMEVMLPDEASEAGAAHGQGIIPGTVSGSVTVQAEDAAREVGRKESQSGQSNLQKNPPGIIDSRLPKVETRKEIPQVKEIAVQREIATQKEIAAQKEIASKQKLRRGNPPHPNPLPQGGEGTGRGKYIVQTGVFRDAKEADMLKSTLSLQGFETKIQKIKAQDGQIWYRVAFGPYASESEARALKKTLKANHIHGILILQRQIDE